jgi:hypothetical protein
VAKKKDSLALFEAISRTKDAPRPTAPQAPQTGGDVPPPLTTAGARKLTVSAPVVVAAIVGAAALVAGAFAIGRLGTAAPRQEQAQQQLSPAAWQPPPAETPASAPARVKGKYYLIVQRLQDDTPADAAEGERIVKFLAQRGEQAELVKGGKTKQFYAVWSMRAFDDPSTQAARDFASHVEKLGAEYIKLYPGTYKFQQRTAPSAPLTPLYWQY